MNREIVLSTRLLDAMRNAIWCAIQIEMDYMKLKCPEVHQYEGKVIAAHTQLVEDVLQRLDLRAIAKPWNALTPGQDQNELAKAIEDNPEEWEGFILSAEKEFIHKEVFRLCGIQR